MMKKLMALALAGMMTLSLAACGNSNAPAASSGSGSAGSDEDAALTYAVEAGSAGERSPSRMASRWSPWTPRPKP